MKRVVWALAVAALGGVGWPGTATGGLTGAFSLRTEAGFVKTVEGDFNGDGVADRLDMWDDPYRWWVRLGGQTTWSLWLGGWGPGERTHVGDFDGDGRADVLVYTQAWHLLLSTGQAFTPRLDVNPGFTLGAPQECVRDFDADAASELIMESTYNTCWQYDAGLSRFKWSHCSRTCAFPRPLYYADDDQLHARDGTPVFVRGTSYIGCRGVNPYAHPTPPAVIEIADPFLFLLADCPPARLQADFLELRERLRVNTVRVLTPGPVSGDASPYGSWFKPDGSISEAARLALQGLFDVAGGLGLRVVVALYADFTSYADAAPGTPGEARAYRYVESLGDAFRDEPALFAYELASEGLLTADNYWNVQANLTAPRALSFYTRMARRLKLRDGNHLVTSGQVATLDRHVAPGPYHDQAWHFPSPEFALVDDVDHLDGGVPFTLYSRVDFLSPHLYAGEQGTTSRGTTAEMASTLRKISLRRDAMGVRKPITLGEAGYDYALLSTAGSPGAPTVQEVAQARFYGVLTGVLDEIGARGLLVWGALPELPLYPGTYTSAQEFPPFNIVTYTMMSPAQPPRSVRVHEGDRWNVFYPVKACDPTPGGPSCEGLADRQAAAPLRSYFTGH